LKSPKSHTQFTQPSHRKHFFNNGKEPQFLQSGRSGQPFFSNTVARPGMINTKCTNCEQGEKLQMKEKENLKEDAEPASVMKSLGAGKPLENRTRAKMERGFGTDFSGVKVHTDSHAASLSGKMNARAFTVGNHIAFGAGEHRPGSLMGDALMAHELAHVEQQKRPGQTGGRGNDSALEKDADHTAGQAIPGMKNNLTPSIKKKIMPRLKTGLKISRCTKSSSGPPSPARRATAVANFESNNSGLTAAEKSKIENAMTIVTASNIDLEIAFYDYYSNEEIIKDPSIKGNELALTKPNSDTRVNPSVLDPSYPANSLGDLLLHEFTHTRHDTNVMGTSDYQEGEAYAVEYFFAERTGDKKRMTEIMGLVGTPGKLSVTSLHPALLAYFRKTYATLKALYEVIDKGSTSYPTSPIGTPTLISKDEARKLATELIRAKEAGRSPQLTAIVSWITANLSSFTLPV
jgi:Domain of unknown function (DUF4157)